MKRVTYTLICFSLIIGLSCSQNGEKGSQNSEESMENDGFGGVGTDPSSGTVVSDDTATSTAPDSVSLDSLNN